MRCGAERCGSPAGFFGGSLFFPPRVCLSTLWVYLWRACRRAAAWGSPRARRSGGHPPPSHTFRVSAPRPPTSSPRRPVPAARRRRPTRRSGHRLVTCEGGRQRGNLSAAYACRQAGEAPTAAGRGRAHGAPPSRPPPASRGARRPPPVPLRRLPRGRCQVRRAGRPTPPAVSGWRWPPAARGGGAPPPLHHATCSRPCLARRVLSPSART